MRAEEDDKQKESTRNSRLVTTTAERIDGELRKRGKELGIKMSQASHDLGDDANDER